MLGGLFFWGIVEVGCGAFQRWYGMQEVLWLAGVVLYGRSRAENGKEWIENDRELTENGRSMRL